MQLSSPETLPQLSRCADSCLRCIVLVVLLGPPLIYHDGSQLVPDEAVGPSLGRCGWFWEGYDGRKAPGLRELGS